MRVIYLSLRLATSGASALPDFPVGYQPLPTLAEKDSSTSVVRMHETGPTSRAQKRTLDSERSSECDYKIPGDVYVTAIPGPSLPPLERRPPPPAPQGVNCQEKTNHESE